ncbi:MAG: GTPase HflX [Bacteroidales bacterium]|jgi:GTP-binding protein HflX|nr:GTPase HflX [Bacteroidales bacterium]
MVNREKVVLVGLIRADQNAEKTHEYLDELSFLAETAGGEEIKRFVQSLPHPDPRTYVGTGKLNEVAEFVQEHEVETVIFDDELTASQIRNIERTIANCKIIDRTRLILDIFSSHAQTAHAKIQVELAQYEYLLPRLTRMWTHLEKQRGGIGMRGPGEKEIETDRRIVRKRMSLLKERLKIIDNQKATQRSNRGAFVRVALVGYTNVGKSTLMNLLSKSETLTENKLFATLDTTVRKVVLKNLPFLLSDTVGFIRKLPHGLIESFKSTLDEVRETHLLIHVVDVSHANFEEQIQVVEQTLLEIGVVNKPMILVFNKIDNYTWIEKEEDDLTPIVKENYSLSDLKRSWMAKSEYVTVFISAKEKENIDELREIIYREVKKLQMKAYPYKIEQI